MISRIVKCLVLLPLGIFALEIQRDFQDAFVFTDNVSSLNTLQCKNDVVFMPEDVSFFGTEEAPGVPYRTYIIALPGSALPSVSIENIKTESLKGKPCGVEKNPQSLKIGEPYFKDNLWRVKVNVPVVYSTGNSWNLRRSFRVKINFNEKASGYSVGKRALAFVANKNGANRFGTRPNTTPVTAFKKPSASTEWLLRIGIGNTDLSVHADGMYAMSFSDLKKVMQNIDGIKVSHLRIFGASPDTLPEAMGNEISTGNLTEIPILVKDKNSDGIFNAGDSIMFFGIGTAIWKKSGSQSGMDYYFSHSPYTFYQYYYLGVDATGNGKRLVSKKKEVTGADIPWKKYARSEKDLLLRDTFFGSMEDNTGKEWFWAWGNEASVTVNSSEFQNSVRTLDNLQGDSIWIGVSFFPRRSISDSATISGEYWKNRMTNINFDFYFQNKKLQNTDIKDTVFGGSFVFASNEAKPQNNEYRLGLKANGKHNIRFDGLSVAYKYNPAASKGDEWLFPGTASGARKIPAPANMDLIKVKDFIPVEILESVNNYAYDTISGEGDTKYFLQKKNSYRTPAFIEAIPNRIDSVSASFEISQETEYLILTSEILQNEAVKLKRFRESGTAVTTFKTTVVLVEDIYKHYGAQASPVAIRDYLRYAKNRCGNLRYVLLAGNGNYDYRKIRQGAKANLIPPYEAEDTASDDFFAILDAGEAIRFGKYNLALAVGRIPVSNSVEFENYIQKAIDYEKVSVMDNGIWRNTVIFNADDAMQGQEIDDIRHTNQMETTANLLDSISQENGFAMELRKISLLQYEKDGMGKKPEAARELLLRLNQGALFTFYYGHGNTVMWADEDLLNTGSLSGLFNAGRYTILGSFSCLVARFDDAATNSLSEVFVTAKSKGAIASIGALRISSSGYNVNLSRKILSKSLFSSSLGEAFLKAKEVSSDSFSSERYNNEKYVLLGEPVLSMPKQEIALNLSNVPDTIQALQKLKISGKASVQEGIVKMQILEGEKSRNLSQNLGNGKKSEETIKIQGSPIYNEEIRIKKGEFSTEFVTPRKLSFGDTSAQIRLWAYNPGTAKTGKTAINGISLFGTSSYRDSINDNTPPSIKIYPCMQQGIANPYAENARVSLELPACLDVEITDSTGIDYREEADEGIFFEISPGANSWHPWSFSEQTGTRAKTRIDFGTSYDPGEYVFKASAQDILGNAAFRSVRLLLNQEIKDGLTDVFNVPNPMRKSGTTFYFKDLSNERQSNVRIKIFDQNGKLVKVINNAISGRTHWDGRDSRGRLLANGLYHYVVQSTVSSLRENEGGKTFEKKQKLLISR